MKPIPIFIGYDPREAIAFHTCVNSIIRHASHPVSIMPLALNNFQDYSETHTDGSNQFIYSRFLVPHLMEYTGHAIFMDGDMIVRGDISELWKLRSFDKDIQVVKHNYKTKMTTKYLGSKNEDYPRKNWSSVMIFNCNNFPTKRLTPEYIQKSTGAHLHRFEWTTDDRVGELPPEWNWLPDEYGPNTDAKLLHYTLGTPCFHDFATTPMADEWHRERMLTEFCLQHDLLK
jgi:lipopolysaccharide biosynthesis glycosyltransferase